MSLSVGAQLGQHQILSLLGKGGMGEVYRARDLRLKRDVAIKTLPDEFARDAERVQRFQREAEVLASLNHPHIAGIYNLEEAGGARYLVLELVEGETLAERVARGALPQAEALAVARSICEALEAAHEKGIVHRDLKPANVKVAPDGTVKVLDFGLAKALESGPQAAMSNSPTLLSAAMTGGGMILGTAGYMSPEQAKGQPADARSDVFSFGCVLYELLTGRQAFHAGTVTETIAAVLMTEPDWQALPQSVHPKLRQLLRRTLAKSRKDRWHAIGDVRVEIESILADPGGAEVSRGADGTPLWKRLVPAGVGVITGVALAVGVVWLLRSPEEASEVSSLRFEVTHPVTSGENQIAIAQDGSRLMTSTGAADGALWLRSLENGSEGIVKGTERAADPFWSPDGRFIGYVADGMLKTLDTLGGSPRTLTEAAANGGAWNQDDTIVFGRGDGRLYRVPAAGGTAEAVTELDTSREETTHLRPHFLPDGRRFLYLARSRKSENDTLVLGSLESSKGRVLTPSAVAAVFSPPRHLLLLRDGTLLAQEVEPSTFELIGSPAPIIEDVASNTGNGRVAVAVSRNGMLLVGHDVFGSSRLVWFDRSTSQRQPIDSTAPVALVLPSLAPDGQRFAAISGVATASVDIWIHDVGRGTASRFTSDPAADRSPVWSRDGARIVLRSRRPGNVDNLFVKDAGGGTPESLLLETPFNKEPTHWSADGRFLVYTEEEPKTSSNIWLLPLTGERRPIPYLQTPFRERDGRLSPDGSWMAYTSNETGVDEVYVQAVPPSGVKLKVSNAGGAEPRWRPDGKELFYRQGREGIFAVDVIRRGADLSLGPATLVVSTFALSYDVTPDGQRFLLYGPDTQASNASRLNVITNWTASLLDRQRR